MRRLLIAGLLAVALTGCASTPKQLEFTGESIVGLATQFDTVSRHVTAACSSRTRA